MPNFTDLTFSSPFPAVDSSILLRDTLVIMGQHHWQLKVHMQDMAQFEKQKRPNAAISALLIVIFSLLGVLVVCLMVAASRKELITFVIDGPNTLRATSSRGTFGVRNQEHIVNLARSVGNGGATYAGAIVLGLVSICMWAVLLPLLGGR